MAPIMGDGDPANEAFQPSELPWQSIAEGAADGLFVTDGELRVLWVNARACQLLERDHAEIVNHRIPEFFWSTGDLVDEPLRAAELGAGQTTLTRRAFRTPSGTRRILEVSAKAVGAGLVLGIARDATATADALEQLQRSEASFRALIERCPEGIVIHSSGVAQYVNTAFATLLGYDSPASLVGRRIIDLVHPDDRAQVVERVDALQKGEGVVPFAEERLVRRDRTAVTLSISGVGITYEGKPAIAAIARDVSEQRMILAQLAHAEKMASLGILSAGVAHEVNNPLAWLTLRLRALAALGQKLEVAVAKARAAVVARVGEEAATQIIDAELGREHFSLMADHVATASEGAERVRAIVEDLRMFSRTDSETARPLDVRQPLKRALSMVGHRIDYPIVLDERRTPLVLASEGRMTQVFVNLLINAGQAIAEETTGENEIEVRVAFEDGHVIVAIRDTGVGIPPENLARIFEPFFTTKPVGVGTGLGLSICHGIVTAYGGTIRVESHVGVGSTFTVALPPAPLEE